MKKEKFFLAFSALTFITALSLPFVSCNNNDDEDDTSPVSGPIINEVTEDTNDEIFSILRELCDLSAINPENTVEDADTEGKIIGGIEELPDNWDSMTFTPDVGYQLPGDDETVWSYPVSSVEKAAEWFYDLIGLTPDADGYTSTQSKNWSIQGLGTLVYKAVTDNTNLYATVEVDIPVIPLLKKINFVPPSVIEAANSENSYNGKPYFTGGDIIQRLSDNTLWMCVRPAGGPLHKDKSYWICLHPFDKNGNSIIKPETKDYALKYLVEGREPEPTGATWTYAKGLMTIKTAKAAFHTLAMIAYAEEYDNLNAFGETQYPFEDLEDVGGINYTTKNLHVDSGKEHGYKYAGFRFAYGSPKKDSVRETRVTDQNLRQYYPKVAQVSYIQPVIDCELNFLAGDKVVESVSTYKKDSFMYTASTQKKKLLISACDIFDDAIIKTFWKGQSYWGKELEYYDEESKSLELITFDQDQWHYDYTKFLHNVDTAKNELCYRLLYRTDAMSYSTVQQWDEREVQLSHVIFSPELVIKDNKGTATAVRKPFKDSQYLVVHRFADTPDKMYDWWQTEQNVVRKVDGTEVNWRNENK